MDVSEFITLIESSVTDLFPFKTARSIKSGRIYRIVSVFLGKAEGFTIDFQGKPDGARGWISLDLLEPTDGWGNPLHSSDNPDLQDEPLPSDQEQG